MITSYTVSSVTVRGQVVLPDPPINFNNQTVNVKNPVFELLSVIVSVKFPASASLNAFRDSRSSSDISRTAATAFLFWSAANLPRNVLLACWHDASAWPARSFALHAASASASTTYDYPELLVLMVVAMMSNRRPPLQLLVMVGCCVLC